MGSGEIKPEIEHGGALGAAMARFGGTAADWLDLSTGISPIRFPLPELGAEVWQRLPDSLALKTLCEAARGFYGGASAPVATPGSQAAIQHLPSLARILDPGARTVAVIGPTYGEYAASFLRAGFQVDVVSDLASAATFDAVVLANPNNPDGRCFSPNALADFASARGNRLTVVDEAFADVTDSVSVCALAGKLPGLVVLRSFGKFFGLAGLRLGFAFGAPEPAAYLTSALGPWAVSGPALAIAAHAFSKPELVDAQRRAISQCAERTEAVVRSIGIPIVGQTGLFLLLDVGSGKLFRTAMAQRQVLVRAFDHSPHHVRIGLVADEAEAVRLSQALNDALSEAG